jgi:hypothetical protein
MTIPKHTAQPQMGLLTAQDVIAAHRAAEHYVRRLFFVALRVNDVQYQSAENIVELTRQTTYFQVFTKSIVLLLPTLTAPDSSKKQLDFDAFMAQQPDLSPLFNAFIAFATPVRFRLAQGNDEENRAAAYRLAYHISKSLVTEIERVLLTEFGHSAFEQPKNWGARTVATPETIAESIQRLALQQVIGATMHLAEVTEILAGTKYVL